MVQLPATNVREPHERARSPGIEEQMTEPVEQPTAPAEIADLSEDAPGASDAVPALDGELILSDLIVEDVSIDGMCGVY
jgi:mycofactocin precursor